MRSKFVVRKTQIYSAFLILLLILFMGANTVNPDIHNYANGYSNKKFAIDSLLYSCLKNTFCSAGISFQWFRLFLYAVGILVIRKSSKMLIEQSAFIYIAYIISLMFIDATQTYNFMGMCFLILGVACLITSEKFNRVKYIICILLASGFHIVFLFYVPFVFIYSKADRKTLIKIYGFTLFIILGVSLFVDVSGLARVINNIIGSFGVTEYERYLVSRTRYGHFYPIMIHLLGCFLSFVFYSKIKKNNENDNERGVMIARILLLLNLYGIFAFPLFRFQLTLGRLTRNLTLLTIISGVNFVHYTYDKKVRRYTYLALLVFVLIVGFDSVYATYYESIVKPFFENNWILGG